jgi:phage portal protein BeeE
MNAEDGITVIFRQIRLLAETISTLAIKIWQQNMCQVRRASGKLHQLAGRGLGLSGK